MPERPLSHQLESESRRAFEALLGNRSVFRPDNPDYGVDGTVEEFDTDFKATGLRYFVQLKASADPDPAKALSRSIPISTATLYGALDLPLLMVGYHQPTGRLYGRWWHARLLGARPPRADAASVNFRWSEEDAADDDASARWAAEARVFLALRSASLVIPLRVGLEVAEPPFGLTAAEIEIAVRGEARQRRDVVDFDLKDHEVLLRVDGRRLSVQVPGTTATEHKLAEDHEAGEMLAIDLMVLLGVALAFFGQADLAARLASSFFASSSLAAQPELAMVLAAAMTRARRLPESLAIAEDIDERFGLGEANTSVLFTLTSRRHSASLTKSEARAYERAMRARIRRREESGAVVEAAREMVSLANHHRSKHEPGPATGLYREAARLDPEYEMRGYYWHELGGVLFIADDFEGSAEAYARAVELGEEGMTPLLLADALLFAGHYEDARAALKAHLTGEESPEFFSEYHLKVIFLDVLIDRLGITRQDRDPKAAEQILAPLIGDGAAVEDAAVIRACGEALQKDGLSNFVWVNHAHATEKVGDLEGAGLMFLSAALCWPRDRNAWALAVLLFWRAGRIDLMSQALVTGQRSAGRREVLGEINKLIASHISPMDRDDLISALSAYIDVLSDPREDGFEVRFVGPGRAVESMVITTATTRGK
jgi:tetratricopeptide (TPR) repeat protein